MFVGNENRVMTSFMKSLSCKPVMRLLVQDEQYDLE